jgi:hypothetical protein
MSTENGVAISGPRQYIHLRIPYWLLVLPLTLLSARLLLFKPRKAKPISNSPRPTKKLGQYAAQRKTVESGWPVRNHVSLANRGS